MAGEKKKCPMCTTKMKMVNGRLTCTSCGYYYRNTAENADYGPAQYGSPGQSYSAKTQYGTARQQTHGGAQRGSGQAAPKGNPYNTPSSSNTSQKNKPKQKNPALQITVGVLVAAISCFTVYSLVRISGDYIRDMMDGPENSSRSQAEAILDSLKSDAGLTSSQEISNDGSSTGSGQDSQDSSGSHSQRLLPESDFFRQLAEAIWGKDYQTITPEEYAGLSALQIHRDDKTIACQLTGEEPLTFSYQSDYGKKLSDLRCFTGLKSLSIDDDLSPGDLDGLEKLGTVFAENTIEDLLSIIPNPESIVELGVEDSIFCNSLEGLASFPNLQYLTVEYNSLEDISALSHVPNLVGLYLKGCDRLTDYSPLMEMTSLQELTIESVQLRTLDFIRVMPQLKRLEIRESMISSLDALADCPLISSLALTENYYIEDYTGLDTLENLTSLELELNYSNQMPSLQNLADLQTFSLKGANDLSVLRNAPNVTALCLERCNSQELEAITSMQELAALEIHDFSYYTESLEPLTRLPKLAALDLADTYIYGDVSEIFGIPSLQYLGLADCRIVLDLENLPANDTLQFLQLDGISIADAASYDEWGAWESVDLSDHYNIFDRFPNLTELYLESTGIDSISFVEKLPKLQYLDITNNNVTSLKPLEALTDFRTVWCGQNNILEPLPEDSSIEVIASDY